MIVAVIFPLPFAMMFLEMVSFSFSVTVFIIFPSSSILFADFFPIGHFCGGCWGVMSSDAELASVLDMDDTVHGAALLAVVMEINFGVSLRYSHAGW
jgi:hypothetical protein